MKPICYIGLFCFSIGLHAQKNGQPNDDQLQQQPPRPTQTQVERSSYKDAKQRSQREVNAERLSKEKGQTQKQTKVQPDGLPPNLTDTVSRVKHERQKMN